MPGKGGIPMNLQTILRKIRRADQDYHLIEDGDVIGVGVSGGKDSMVLLCALQMYSRFRDKNFRVVGILIEMGFPDMDFSQADAFCARWGIALHHYPSQIYEILKRNLAKDGSLQCSLCSKFKKATVITAAKELGCTKVAFGHHSHVSAEDVHEPYGYDLHPSTDLLSRKRYSAGAGAQCDPLCKKYLPQ